MLGSRNGAAPERSSTDSSKCTLEMQELHIPERRSGETVKLQFVIFKKDTTCAMCESGWTGRRECPRDKWVCSPEKGGCTYFNSKSQFYCEVCNRARPDLAGHRLV